MVGISRSIIAFFRCLILGIANEFPQFCLPSLSEIDETRVKFSKRILETYCFLNGFFFSFLASENCPSRFSEKAEQNYTNTLGYDRRVYLVVHPVLTFFEILG